ncbi:hypothetical protein HY031_01965 [Candidatus Gottesmanbacteria bacterium]|nr:hypothetical protein [Candidatus Gottesmanbacteria bacterium]
MAKESDGCLGAATGFVELGGAAVAGLFNNLALSPALFDQALKLKETGQLIKAELTAEAWAFTRVPPELAWTQWLGAGMVVASTADRFQHRQGHAAEAFVVGASLLFTPQAVAFALEHPEWLSGFQLFTFGLSVGIAAIEGGRMAWGLISRARRKVAANAPIIIEPDPVRDVFEPIPSKDELYKNPEVQKIFAFYRGLIKPAITEGVKKVQRDGGLSEYAQVEANKAKEHIDNMKNDIERTLGLAPGSLDQDMK